MDSVGVLEEFNVNRLLLAIIKRAAKDARGDLADVPRGQRAILMEDARRFIYSPECETFGLEIGFSARHFREYRNLIPRPREEDGTRTE